MQQMIHYNYILWYELIAVNNWCVLWAVFYQHTDIDNEHKTVAKWIISTTWHDFFLECDSIGMGVIDVSIGFIEIINMDQLKIDLIDTKNNNGQSTMKTWWKLNTLYYDIYQSGACFS